MADEATPPPGNMETVAEFREWVRETLEIELPSKFDDDDWTLVVKLHAMIETALNSTIILHLGTLELRKVIANLDTSNQKTGKAAFAKALNILPHNSIVFIQKLSELRNVCVHDIRNFSFNLINHIDNMEDGDRKAFYKVISKETTRAINSPQEGLKMAAMNIIVKLCNHHLKCAVRDAQTAMDRFASEILAHDQSTPKESRDIQSQSPL
jgi:hypothetical protein